MNLGYLDRLEGKYEHAISVLDNLPAQLKKLDADQLQVVQYLTELGVNLTRLGDFSRAKILLEEAISNAKLPIEQALAFGAMGLLETAQMEGKPAAINLIQCLQILQEINERFRAISTLEDYAGALHLLDQDTKAARILGTMAAVRGQIGAPLPPGDQPRQERLLADLRAQLGETGFDQAWNEGQAMIRQKTPDTALDETLAFALEP